MKKTRILVVDDHDLVRDGIVSMLNNVEDVQVVADAGDGEEAIEKLKTIDVDIVLTDVQMPNMNGLELTEHVTENFEEVRVVLLSMEVTEEYIGEAVKNGASSYLPKNVRKKELVDAIRAVRDGEEYFPPEISQVIFKSFVQKKNKTKSAQKVSGKISEREIEVIRLIVDGKSNKEIADELFISVRTVDAHRNHIMTKLELKNTAQLVKYAIKTGLVDLN